MSNFLDKEKRLIEEFNNLKPDLLVWGKSVCDYIKKELFESEHFDNKRLQFQPSFRLKENKSLLQKAFFGTDGMTQATDKLLKITDKIGVRIVVLTEEDVLKVQKIVSNTNIPIWKNIRIARKIDNISGYYKGVHIEVYPSDDSCFSKKYTDKELKYLSCEIQIRTLLQHAYSEVRHQNTYKRVHRIDGEVEVMLQDIFNHVIKSDDYFCEIYRRMQTADISIENFFTEIAKVYLSISPLIVKKNEALLRETVINSNHRLNNLVLNLYDINEIDITDVKEIINNNNEDIRILIELINKEDTFLNNEPIIIYLAFLVLTRPNSLKKKWIADDMILREVYHKLNKSFENE